MKPPTQCPAYTRATIKEIRKAAGGKSVRHIHPRAYCVAKPAPHCAVFAIPSCDSEPHMRGKHSISVHNETAASAVVGGWYALAYVSDLSGGEPRVIIDLNEK